MQVNFLLYPWTKTVDRKGSVFLRVLGAFTAFWTSIFNILKQKSFDVFLANLDVFSAIFWRFGPAFRRQFLTQKLSTHFWRIWTFFRRFSGVLAPHCPIGKIKIKSCKNSRSPIRVLTEKILLDFTKFPLTFPFGQLTLLK